MNQLQKKYFIVSFRSNDSLFKSYIIIGAILLAIVRLATADQFCSAYCKPNQCSGTFSTQCTDCVAPFTISGGMCILNANSGFEVFGQSQVNQFATGNILVMNISLGTETCTGFSFKGNLTDASRFKLTSPIGTTSPHFKIHLIFFAVMNDDWDANARITINLVGTTQYQTRQRDNQDQKDRKCFNSAKQDNKFRVWQSFTHTSTDDTIPIEFQIYITKNSQLQTYTPNSNDQWGVKQFIIMAQLCHSACTLCWGNQVDQCTECQQNTPMYLSGTTCNETCLDGYGFTDYSTICVLCDKRCDICYNASDNCTACTPTGNFASFLVAVNFSCVAVCPDGYFGNTTNRICQPCNFECTTCKLNSSYCLSCNVTLGYGWNNFVCYNPCPKGTFSNLGGTNCTTCNSKCIDCQNSSTQCFSCMLSGPNEAYYFLNVSNPLVTCFANCPISYYKENYSGVGPNQCLPCDISCYECSSSPKPCTICNAHYFLYQGSCSTNCPLNYFGDVVTWKCLPSDKNSTILTIIMKFSNRTNQQIFTDFYFSEDINFTTFPYQNFQDFSFDNDKIFLRMFTISHLITSNSSYRVILKPIGFVLQNVSVTITVTTMSMPQLLHKAINQRPFRANNYQKTEKLQLNLIEQGQAGIGLSWQQIIIVVVVALVVSTLLVILIKFLTSTVSNRNNLKQKQINQSVDQRQIKQAQSRNQIHLEIQQFNQFNEHTKKNNRYLDNNLNTNGQFIETNYANTFQKSIEDQIYNKHDANTQCTNKKNNHEVDEPNSINNKVQQYQAKLDKNQKESKQQLKNGNQEQRSKIEAQKIQNLQDSDIRQIKIEFNGRKNQSEQKGTVNKQRYLQKQKQRKLKSKLHNNNNRLLYSDLEITQVNKIEDESEIAQAIYL